MKILGLNHVASLNTRAELRVWVGAWVAEVRQANWKRDADVIAHFPSAIQVAVNRFRFVSEESVCVEVVIAYQQGIVLILFADENCHEL